MSASLRAAAVLAVMGTVSTAAAHSDYPGIIQDTFGSTCAPQCTLCHVNPAGGLPVKGSESVYVAGPSNRGYGVFVSNLYYRTAGGIPLTSKNLPDKLRALKVEACNNDATKGDDTDKRPCDTDADGKSDYDELAVGHDPDTSGTGPECPAYGCGASIGTLPRDADKSGRAGAAIAALGVALVLARRLRR